MNQAYDLAPSAFPPELDWSAGNQEETLRRLYDFVMQECSASISWYYRKKGSKKWFGLLLRLGVILSVGLAGLIPLLAELLSKSGDSRGIPPISPGWSTVALAVAGVFIAIDRFGGYTSGWVRYIRTAQALTRLQGDFQLDWEEMRLARCLQPDGPEPVKAAILLCRQFLQKVYEQVRLESDLWAREFQQALLDVENHAVSSLPRPRGGNAGPEDQQSFPATEVSQR